MASPNDTGSTGCGADSGGKEVIKSQFITREGTYKLMTLSEYSRPNRVAINSPSQGNNVVAASSVSVHVSFVSVPADAEATVPSQQESACSSRERICFNVGRELYVYNYEGVSKAADLSRPIDKRVYKGTSPTCHDFNQATCSAEYCELLVGFSAGQIQLINPLKKDNQINRLFNEDRLIDKTRVTCLRWIPSSKQHFLAAHASGHLYVYNAELNYVCSLPSYQLFKQGDGYSIHICKTKSSRNPVYRWTLGDGSVNEFEFSPDGRQLATVSEDGYLRVFDYNTMELTGLMRSYFGGLLCVAWSPDARYIATGGEDDLVTIYSVSERRAVCRGQGHRSWVSKVAFDPYATQVISAGSILHLDSDEDLRTVTSSTTNNGSSMHGGGGGSGSGQRLSVPDYLSSTNRQRPNRLSTGSISSLCGTTYRFGSVGHDTLLCLWDLSEDELKPAPPSATAAATQTVRLLQRTGLATVGAATDNNNKQSSSSRQPALSKNSSSKTASLNADMQNNTTKSKRLLINFTGSSASSTASSTVASSGKPFGAAAADMSTNAVGGKVPGYVAAENGGVTLGSPICPYLSDIPMIQPLLTKKIAHERLSVIVFRPDSIVTACQEGFICTWARPGRSSTYVSAAGQPSMTVDGASTGATVV